jgi:MFS family permease
VQGYHELKGKGLLFLLFLWFLWFFNFTARAIFSPILPLVEDEFVISHARATSIFIFFSTGYGLAVLFSGLYSGRFGYKKSILLSLCISSFVCFLIPFTKAFSALYVFNFVLGFSIGAYLPSVMPLITEYFAEKHWGKAIAIHDTGAAIAIFSTPFIALCFLRFTNWRGIFEVFAVVFLASAVALYFVCDELKIGHSERVKVGDFIRSRSLWIMTVLFTFVAGANMGVFSIAPLYLTKELLLSIEYANSIVGISRLGGIVVSVTCGFLIDRFNLRRFLFIVTLISGICTVLVGVAPVRFMGISLFLQAVVITAFFPVGLVSIARLFKREARGMATGFILASTTTFGAGLTPYLLGLAGDYLSFRVGIMLFGILVSLSSLCTFSLKEIR